MIEDKLLRSLGDQLGRFIGDAALREDMQKLLGEQQFSTASLLAANSMRRLPSA